MGGAAGLGRAVAAVGLGVLLTALITEALIRSIGAMPRTQIVDESEVRDLVQLEGQWVWRESARGVDAFRACVSEHPDDARIVLLVGSSISYGTGVEGAETFAAHLMAASADDRPVCVYNAAQPAFVGAQKLAMARAMIPRLSPELVVWEVWGDPSRYARVGRRLYRVTHAMRVDAAGQPSLLPMPPALNAWLLTRSRAWEYATLALSAGLTPDPELPREAARDLALGMTEAAREGGTKLLAVFTPPFDGPLRPVLAAPTPQNEAILGVLQEAGATWVDLGAALEGVDPREIGLDDVCHYNAAGHRRVAEVLGPVVREALAR